MLTDQEILQLYKDPKFAGSFSGVRIFRDFLYGEKHELVSVKRLYSILKQDPIYLQHMKPIRKFPIRHYDVQSFGNTVQMDLGRKNYCVFWSKIFH